jgi:hypothetical protein
MTPNMSERPAATGSAVHHFVLHRIRETPLSA